MQITEIFTDSLKYPTKNWKNFFILGILTLIVTALGLFPSIIGSDRNGLISIVAIVCSILALIVGFIINGYILSNVKSSINLKDNIPDFNINNNLIDGLKLLIINIVYGLIFLIIIMIITFFSGFLESIIDIISIAINNPGANTTQFLTLIPENVANTFQNGFLITGILGLIIGIIFALFYTISYVRLADSENIGIALNIKEIYGDIQKIGLGNYIIWIILYILISIVISLIMGIIFIILGFIPYISVALVIIISALLFEPYVSLFSARAIGLLYSGKKD
ncbi:DUF4013 domain-containing protein [Methanobrevibacter sp. OttesenSCG-928-K11]|nr:DUF4013 domain-containing protein [Methanobrevibacter sp. OttesenSCG-928-K11]